MVFAWAGFAATLAHAQTIAIPVSGAIAGACTLTKGGDFANADLSASGSRTATATVNCNTGFIIRATSLNGAMKTGATPPANFTNTQPYTLTVSVPLDSGGPVASSCTAALLKAGSGCALATGGSGLSSGTATATNKTATLTAAWTTPALPTRLIAGGYTDTISISISAAP